VIPPLPNGRGSDETEAMSKVIKQMQMDALRKTLEGVRDVVVLRITGLDCHADNALRSTLRKKNIRLHVVKNSLTRRIFDEMGMSVPAESPFWQGPTTLAWGGDSLAELSKAIDTELKAPKTAALYKDKVVPKGALADGQMVTFKQATEMPTKAEAIGRIVMLALSPAGRLVSQLRGPVSRVAGQVKAISEKPAGAEAAPAAAPPA
jgi:large subunit ribosomal protein L10